MTKETSNPILVNSDNLEYLKGVADNSIDSCVTDPPYGLKFMGSKWDYSVPSIELWKEVLRVLKPGAHALVFCGTRTQHRMVCNLEDAGFEIRDVITWVYGSGFPKSMDIGKKLDNWQGWGTALKPACEFITLIRKPISENTIVDNVRKWGVGGINIDDSRIEINGEVIGSNRLETWSGFGQKVKPDYTKETNSLGRWPANLIHDGSDEVLSVFPHTKSGARKKSHVTGDQSGNKHNHGVYGKFKAVQYEDTPASEGSASRFFYCAKPSVSEKNYGLEESDMKVASIRDAEGDKDNWDLSEGKVRERFVTKPHANFHPTVKPVALMQYLVRLITPKAGTVIDPYMGSGTTGVACKLLDNPFIGVELSEEFYNIALGRINT